MTDDPKKEEGTAGKAIDKVAEAPQDQPVWMTEHEKRDDERFNEQKGHFDRRIEEQNKLIATLATKKDIEGLATDKSVKDLIKWQKAIIVGGTAISTGGKWFYRTVLILGPFVAALLVITGGWKTLVGFLFSPRL